MLDRWVEECHTRVEESIFVSTHELRRVQGRHRRYRRSRAAKEQTWVEEGAVFKRRGRGLGINAD